ncbi:MAG: nicotinate phosphoribosyltransferase [Bacteroidales bacterium]|nr:nicotinate phosphoribosyltransferase [Bacteroidales bacterium]
MKLIPIIDSLLVTDQYKMNMASIISRKYNSYTCRWTFKCRNKDVKFTEEMVDEIREQVDYFCSLRFAEEELAWLGANLPWLNKGFLNFLRYWHPDRREIKINEGDAMPVTDCGLAIESEGTWLNTSLYEIPILAIVNEVYFAFKYGDGALDEEFKRRANEKFRLVNTTRGSEIGLFSEFGLRRRLSAATQDWLVSRFGGKMVGTSNLYLARKHQIRAVGTMAHEFIQGVGQGNPLYNPAYSNALAMADWVEEFGTNNGIYLTDCITTDCFLKDFGDKFAHLFSGVRHDSADPIEWGEKMIRHYRGLGIDPVDKTLLFSDSLNFEKAHKIYAHFSGRAKVAFGIGTYLSNDAGVEPLNIVMKMTECNGRPVAKISDDASKGMCRDKDYIEYLKRTIEWRMCHG